MKRLYYKIIQGLVFSLVAILLFTGGIGNCSAFSAFADTTSYTDVLSDLQKDDTFDISEYPDDPNDYSLQVIQIAESENGELFLYTYQPCQRTTYLVATEINMSFNETVDGTQLYKLELLSCSGTLCKYLVKGVKVSSDDVRYYNITSIYRDWIEGVDKKPVGNSFLSSASFSVNRLFIVRVENGVLKYIENSIQVIEIKTPYFNYLRYYDGFYLFQGDKSCDSHYIAFNTDIDIDRIIEAEVSFSSQFTEFIGGLPVPSHKKESYQVKLSDIDTVTNTANGLRGVKHEWNRIETVKDFIKNEDLTKEVKDSIKNLKWIIRYYETPYNYFKDWSASSETYYTVSDVVLLRLTFDLNGKIYNLGAVCDKGYSGSDPGNNPDNQKFNLWQFILNCIKNVFSGNFGIVDLLITILFFIVILIVVVVILYIVFLIIKHIEK